MSQLIVQPTQATIDVGGVVQGIKNGLDSFMEDLPWIMKGLDEVAKIHPFLGGDYAPLHLQLPRSKDIYRRHFCIPSRVRIANDQARERQQNQIAVCLYEGYDPSPCSVSFLSVDPFQPLTYH